LIILIILGEGYKSRSSSLCNFLHSQSIVHMRRFLLQDICTNKQKWMPLQLLISDTCQSSFLTTSLWVKYVQSNWKYVLYSGARSSVVPLGTMLQGERWRFRIPMRLLESFQFI
jgi:hypothetical protein